MKYRIRLLIFACLPAACGGASQVSAAGPCGIPAPLPFIGDLNYPADDAVGVTDAGGIVVVSGPFAPGTVQRRAYALSYEITRDPLHATLANAYAPPKFADVIGAAPSG